MPRELPGPLSELTQQVVDYLPTLAAGLVVIGLGVAVGWLARRAVIRILVWLRLDRLGGRLGWRAAFGKGDVRAALYKVLGTIAMLLVFLAFLDNALQIWGLTVLSQSIHAMVVYLPNLALVGVILAVGVWLANGVARRVEETLEDEGAPRPRLVAKLAKATVLAVVCAVALWQLALAKEIVLAAFVIIFGAIGVAFALSFGLGTAKAIQRGLEALLDKNGDSEGDRRKK
jgi:hypothetical protein